MHLWNMVSSKLVLNTEKVVRQSVYQLKKLYYFQGLAKF